MSSPRAESKSSETKKTATELVSKLSVLTPQKTHQQIQIEKYKRSPDYFTEDYLQPLREKYPVSLVKVSLEALRSSLFSHSRDPQIQNILSEGKESLNNLDLFTSTHFYNLIDFQELLLEDGQLINREESATAAEAISYLILVIIETFFPDAGDESLTTHFFKDSINLSRFANPTLEAELIPKAQKAKKQDDEEFTISRSLRVIVL